MHSDSPPDATLGPLIDRLVAACSSFAPVWNDAVSERVAVGGEPTVLMAASAFADHLLDRLLVGRTEEFPAVFATIETMLIEDDPWLGEVFGLYFIEDLQGAGLRDGRWQAVDPFLRWLGPRAKEAWQATFYRWKSDAGLPPTL